jgi:hypothetical protein
MTRQLARARYCQLIPAKSGMRKSGGRRSGKSAVGVVHHPSTHDGEDGSELGQLINIDVEGVGGVRDQVVPATFLIDRAGVIRAAHVSDDYRTRMEPAAVIAALDILR